MKKLTRMQHRGIIGGLVAGNGNVEDLRHIQRVAELFREERETCTGGETLVACDAVRLLLGLEGSGHAQEAYSALYGVLEDRDGTAGEILEILDRVDGGTARRLLSFIRAYTQE